MIVIVEYIVIASIVVWLSIKASEYIDMLDKVSSLSGAFLGGVLLSAVTSLPELFTSISAVTLLHKPGLCIGNILGSNIFNSAMLAFVAICSFRLFRNVQTSRGNRIVGIFVMLIYAVLVADYMGWIGISFCNVSIVTPIVVLLYFFGVRYLAGESSDKQNTEIKLSKRSIIVRFTLSAIGIVASSIIMTYVTDDLAAEFGIGSGLAGAIFLGVATSLPEVSSTIALFRMRNYDVAVGNIVGSNLFNFFILCIADVMCLSQVIYDYSDPKVVSLAIFGLASAISVYLMLRLRSQASRFAAALATIAAYFAFLIL